MSDVISDADLCVPEVVLATSRMRARRTVLRVLVAGLSALIALQVVLLWGLEERRTLPVYVGHSTLLIPVNGKDLRYELHATE
jgi:hypothetical protein